MNSFLRKLALAGTPDAASRSAPAEETNLEGATGRSRRWPKPVWLTPWVAVWILGLAGLLTGQASWAQEPVFDSPGGFACVDGPAYNPGLSGCLGRLAPPPLFPFASFYVDYRIRRFRDAHTSYEIGWSDPAATTPLSRLEFPISSTWNGLELGLEDPRWAVRAEWLTPWSDRIDGRLEDRDWLFLGPDPSDLGIADQRWIDAHVVDIAFEIVLAESARGLPISIRPVGGFRWQKFDLMAFDGKQLQEFGVWLTSPIPLPGDVIRFRQEYYHYYGGGQLRIDVPPGGLLPGFRLTFQGDGAYVEGHNFDHHLLREGILIGKENTYGSAWHIGATAEIFLTDRFTVGIEGEYTQIRTAGDHRDINEPLGLDETWEDDAHVWSDQTAVTVFLRLRG